MGLKLFFSFAVRILRICSLKNFLLKYRQVILILMTFLGCLGSCGNDPEAEGMTPMEVDDTKARFVVEGTPWQYDRYELLEVRERNRSLLTEEELDNLISDDFSDVVIEFRENGTGTEVGFDGIPSSFFWELNSSGNVIFLDQLGNEFSPLGLFQIDVGGQEISFTFEFPFQDVDQGERIVVYGTTFLKSAS